MLTVDAIGLLAALVFGAAVTGLLVVARRDAPRRYVWPLGAILLASGVVLALYIADLLIWTLFGGGTD